jgi:hypothetical protein
MERLPYHIRVSVVRFPHRACNEFEFEEPAFEGTIEERRALISVCVVRYGRQTQGHTLLKARAHPTAWTRPERDGNLKKWSSP